MDIYTYFALCERSGQGKVFFAPAALRAGVAGGCYCRAGAVPGAGGLAVDGDAGALVRDAVVEGAAQECLDVAGIEGHFERGAGRGGCPARGTGNAVHLIWVG